MALGGLLDLYLHDGQRIGLSRLETLFKGQIGRSVRIGWIVLAKQIDARPRVYLNHPHASLSACIQELRQHR